MRAELLNELRRIQGKKPYLAPESVVEFARDPATALHAQFEWDDTRAAHAHRLEQARQLLRVFIRVLDAGDGNEVPMRMFVNLLSDGYEQTEDVIADDGRRRELVLAQIKRVESILESYPLVELTPVRRAIDRVKGSVAVKEAAA